MKDNIIENILYYDDDNGIIFDEEAYTKQLMNRREKREILKKHHHYSIYYIESVDRWFTHIKDTEKGVVSRSRKTREALEDYLVEYYTSHSGVSIKQVFEAWIKEKCKYREIQKQTYDRYCRDFKVYFEGTEMENKDVCSLTEEELEYFIRDTIVNHDLTIKSYGNFRTIVYGIFKYAKKKRYTTMSITNFFGDLQLSRRMFRKASKKDDENIFYDYEIDMIMAYINKNPDLVNLGIKLDFYTGLRVGELSALKHSDFENGRLHIERTEVRYEDETGKSIFEVSDHAKTDAGNRTLILSKAAIEVLKEIRLKNPFGEYMFMKDGKRMLSQVYARRILQICDKLGIKRRSMHKIRKTFATKMINAGVDERIIISQMGHTDIACTKNYYLFNNKTEEEMRTQIERAVDY